MYRQILAKWNRFAARCSRDRYLPPRLLPYLQETQTVLDIGTFDGRARADSHGLQSRSQASPGSMPTCRTER